MSTVGGRGRARIITNFSHHHYEIWSQDWYVYGEGSQYRCEDHNWTKGCRVQVLVDTIYHGQSLNMMDALRKYLSLAQFSCTVMVNGERWQNWCYRRRQVCELSFGSVYANKSGGEHPSTLIVRIGGTPMFTRWIGGGIQVVLEMTPSQSQNVLLSNRDSLSIHASNELDAFIRSLTTRKSSVLRSQARKEYHFGLNDPYKTYRKTIKNQPPVKITTMAAKPIICDVNQGADRLPFSQPVETESFASVDELIRCTSIVCESSNSRVRKVVDSYHPYNWQKQWNNTTRNYYMKGRVKRDLLRLWISVCEEMIGYWLELTNQDSISWVPGFIFSDYDDAAHQCEDGVHRFLLNPVDKDGKMRYSIRSRKDWGRLIALACHEAVHIKVDGHDEDWACFVTELDALSRWKTNKIFQKMKNILQNNKKSEVG